MSMNLVFFGSGSFGLPTLDRLVAEHCVKLVVTQPDRPAGRRRRLAPTPVGRFAAEQGLDSIMAPDVNDPETFRRIRGAGADAFVVIAFGQKLGAELIDDVLAVNLHASLLPKYRGAAPVNWAMINGEAETGVSVITISQRIDAGDVLGRRATPIDPQETAGELQERLAELGPQLMIETLDLHVTGKLGAQPQDDAGACRAPRLAKSDGTVCFDQAATAVQRPGFRSALRCRKWIGRAPLAGWIVIRNVTLASRSTRQETSIHRFGSNTSTPRSRSWSSM